jgi:hypothetical protein
MKAGLVRVVAGVVLAFFVGSLFFSLYHLASGMDMVGGMSDCPFMSHEEVICPMSLIDHIGAWKSAFLAVVPTVMLLAAAGALAIVLSIAPNLFVPRYKPIPLLRRQLGERTYTFSYRPLQELFSNGILHPKLF